MIIPARGGLPLNGKIMGAKTAHMLEVILSRLTPKTNPIAGG